jgi:PTS system cellobiose-specific IIA component
MDDARLEVVMGIIMNGGNAKGFAVQAIGYAKEGKFDEADEALKQADDALLQAHHTQTQMLTDEANGKHTEIDLYMVHAQDHLMTGIAFKDLAKEIVELYKKLAEK